jgi:TetR/AcrR family transcriptional repressor of nem operon
MSTEMRRRSPYRSPVRDQRKDETRAALIDAAVELFQAEGTEAPSLDRICAAAGCTRGAFYVHFETREELIVAAMELALQQFVGRVLAAGAASDAAGFVDAFLASIARRAPEVGGTGALRFHHLLDACARYPQVRARYLRLLDAAAETLRARLVPHARRDDRAARAETLVLVALGLLASIDLERPIDVDALRPVLRALV